MTRIPEYIVIEDPHGAYAARYHDIVPEGEALHSVVIRAYGGSCVCCGHDEPQEMTLDHIEPVRGGSRRRFIVLWRANFPKDNLQLMCRACNSAKGAGRECPHTVIARHAAFYMLLLLQGNSALTGALTVR